jgi:hypothetical protein
VPLGLGIGRLVFRALNVTEVVLAVLITVGCLAASPGRLAWALLGLAWLVLAVQAGVLRPRLDRRASAIIAGHTPPPSRQHLAYVALELTKGLVLIGLGGALLATVRR